MANELAQALAALGGGISKGVEGYYDGQDYQRQLAEHQQALAQSQQDRQRKIDAENRAITEKKLAAYNEMGQGMYANGDLQGALGQLEASRPLRQELGLPLGKGIVGGGHGIDWNNQATRGGLAGALGVKPDIRTFNTSEGGSTSIYDQNTGKVINTVNGAPKTFAPLRPQYHWETNGHGVTTRIDEGSGQTTNFGQIGKPQSANQGPKGAAPKLSDEPDFMSPSAVTAAIKDEVETKFGSMNMSADPERDKFANERRQFYTNQQRGIRQSFQKKVADWHRDAGGTATDEHDPLDGMFEWLHKNAPGKAGAR